MKKLTLTFALLTFLFASPVMASHDGHDHSAGETCNEIAVGVNGLVCDFCARALEKIFGKRDDVKDIAVDLDNGLVTIHMRDGKTLDDDTITKLITDAGYNITSIGKEC